MEKRNEMPLFELWEIAGEIYRRSEKDQRYAAVYQKLSEALDIAEQNGLIIEDEL